MKNTTCFEKIVSERAYQKRVGKGDTHTLGDWLMIADDYRGKAARAAFNGNKGEFTRRMIQYMAVLMACLEEYGDG